MENSLDFKWSYLWIPSIVLLIALLGSYFTAQGMHWYKTTLQLPWFVPPRWVFGPVWSAIYALTALAAVIWYEHAPRGILFSTTAGLFLANGVLNLLWSILFFGMHWTLPAFVDCAVLAVITIALFIVLIPQIGILAILLAPYALWSSFATYLSWSIVLLNR